MPCMYNPLTGDVETLHERYVREDMVAYDQQRQRKIDAMSDEEFANLLRSGSDPMDAALRLLEEAA